MTDFEDHRPASLAAMGAALRKAREGRAFTLDEVARLTGISKPYLSNIETGSSPGPASEEKLRKIARALRLPAAQVLAAADWLRTPASVRRAVRAAEAGARRQGEEGTGRQGDAPRRADGTINLDALMGDGEEKAKGKRQSATPGVTTTDDAAGRSAPLPLRNVPIINRVAAGKASEFTDLSYPAGIADGYVAAPDLPEAPVAAAFAVRVAGDSMMPEYREGDLVIVGPAPPRDGDDCVVRLGEADNFATTFKRVFFERDEKGEAAGVRLVPLNPAHAERRVPLEGVTGIYPLMYRLVPRRP